MQRTPASSDDDEGVINGGQRAFRLQLVGGCGKINVPLQRNVAEGLRVKLLTNWNPFNAIYGFVDANSTKRF